MSDARGVVPERDGAGLKRNGDHGLDARAISAPKALDIRRVSVRRGSLLWALIAGVPFFVTFLHNWETAGLFLFEPSALCDLFVVL